MIRRKEPVRLGRNQKGKSRIHRRGAEYAEFEAFLIKTLYSAFSARASAVGLIRPSADPR
jgi:hypothetical protein